MKAFFYQNFQISLAEKLIYSENSVQEFKHGSLLVLICVVSLELHFVYTRLFLSSFVLHLDVI